MASESVSHSAVSDSLRPHGLQPARLLCSWDFRQEYWSGLPCPSPGDFPDPEIEPTLAGRFFPVCATREASPQQRPSGSQSLKYLLSGPSWKSFADLFSRAVVFKHQCTLEITWRTWQNRSQALSPDCCFSRSAVEAETCISSKFSGDDVAWGPHFENQ